MNKFDFIKLFSSLLLESDNPYFRKSDLGKFLYDYYDDPQYKDLLANFDVRCDNENYKTYIVDLNFETLVLARNEFLTIADLYDLTFIANYSFEDTLDMIELESLEYIPEIVDLLDTYLKIDFNHSKSK